MPSMRVRVQRQPVEHRVRRARGPGGRQILGVGVQDGPRVARARLSAAACSARFLVSVLKVAKLAGGDAGPPRGVVHLLDASRRRDGACTLINPAYRTCCRSQLSGRSATTTAGSPPRQPAGLALTVMAARVCVVGSVNADLTFTVDALPRPGQTVLASSLSSAPGRQGRQSGGGRRARGRVRATRRRARHRRRGRAAARPPARQRRRARRRGQPARAQRLGGDHRRLRGGEHHRGRARAPTRT